MNETKYYLVEWDSNWADEIDVTGFAVFKGEDLKQYKEKLQQHKSNITFYIGTNEEIEYKNGQAVLDDLTITEIEFSDFRTIQYLFDGSYGFTNFLECGDDEDEDYDDEEE